VRNVVVLCPRCNRLGYAFKSRRGNKYYVYVKHVAKVGNRIRYEYCYVGPEDEYHYVQKIHGGLGLTNTIEQDYAVTVLSAVEKQLQFAERLVNQGKRREAEELLKRLLDVLSNAISEVLELVKTLGIDTS